jgi:hypothetical protein
MRIAGKSKDNSNRKYRGGGPRPDHVSYKREEALIRQEKYNALSIEEKKARNPKKFAA